jgi:putative transposase
LIPELNPNSTLILDNAPFHRKNDVYQIAQDAGHSVLFLPPYSPDFNRIEQDFAIIKKRRIYSAPDISLYDIVKSYGS